FDGTGVGGGMLRKIGAVAHRVQRRVELETAGLLDPFSGSLAKDGGGTCGVAVPGRRFVNNSDANRKGSRCVEQLVTILRRTGREQIGRGRGFGVTAPTC